MNLMPPACEEKELLCFFLGRYNEAQELVAKALGFDNQNTFSIKLLQEFQNRREQERQREILKKKQQELKIKEEVGDIERFGESIQQIREEADRRIREDTERRVKEETERRVKEETDRRIKEEADRRVKEETDRRIREEAERKIREEDDRKEKERSFQNEALDPSKVATKKEEARIFKSLTRSNSQPFRKFVKQIDPELQKKIDADVEAKEYQRQRERDEIEKNKMLSLAKHWRILDN